MPKNANKPRILFACQGNTCRSLMAEYIARDRFGDIIDPTSAGFSPQSAEDAENAIFTLRNYLGIDASSHWPRSIHDLDVQVFDWIIAMDPAIYAKVRSAFAGYPEKRVVKWRISDPWGGDLTEYRRRALDILAAIRKLDVVTGNA